MASLRSSFRLCESPRAPARWSRWRRRSPRRPGPLEVPAGHLVVRAIHQDDRPVLPLDLAVQRAHVQVVELAVVGHPALEDDVRELVVAGQLPDGAAPFTVLDHVNARLEAAALVKRGHLQAVDLDAEVEVEKW